MQQEHHCLLSGEVSAVSLSRCRGFTSRLPPRVATAEPGCLQQTRKGGRMLFYFFFFPPQAPPDNAALLQRVLGAGGCRVTRAGSRMQQVYQSGSRFSVLLEVAEIN